MPLFSFFFRSVLSSALHSLFLENPGDGDPLGVFRNRFQGSLDGAVGLVQVVVDDAEVKVLTVGRLDLAALVARPLQLFILRRKTHDLVLRVLTEVLLESQEKMFCLGVFLTVSVLVTTPASAADWFIAFSTSKSGD